MTQRVTGPKHISSSSADNILDVIIHHTHPSPIRDVKVIDVGLTDHCLLVASLSTPPAPIVLFHFRNIKMLNRGAFLNRLQSASFMCNPRYAVDLFYNQVMLLVFLII